MDDKAAIEYHPFGTVTLNFDEGPIKLRRCRLGDLEYAKNYLQELRDERKELSEGISARWLELFPEGATPEGDALRDRNQRLNGLLEEWRTAQIDLTYRWLTSVIERMGDGQPPEKDMWPVDLFAHRPLIGDEQAGQTVVIADVLNHWQNRPLGSGRISQNGATPEAAASNQSHPVLSSPPVPPLQ